MIYCLILLVLLLAAFPIQEFIPVFNWASSSQLLLVHAMFFASAVSVPFPVMLIYALVTGFIWDCRHFMPINSPEGMAGAVGQMEIPFGFTIFLFGLLGTFIQGVRPFFRQGRWLLPVLMAGVCTLICRLIEYFMICFHRGGIETSPELWMNLFLTALYSTLLAPFLLLMFSKIAGATGFKIQMDGISRRYSYDGDTF